MSAPKKGRKPKAPKLALIGVVDGDAHDGRAAGGEVPAAAPAQALAAKAGPEVVHVGELIGIAHRVSDDGGGTGVEITIELPEVGHCWIGVLAPGCPLPKALMHRPVRVTWRQGVGVVSIEDAGGEPA